MPEKCRETGLPAIDSPKLLETKAALTHINSPRLVVGMLTGWDLKGLS